MRVRSSITVSQRLAAFYFPKFLNTDNSIRFFSFFRLICINQKKKNTKNLRYRLRRFNDRLINCNFNCDRKKSQKSRPPVNDILTWFVFSTCNLFQRRYLVVEMSYFIHWWTLRLAYTPTSIVYKYAGTGNIYLFKRDNNFKKFHLSPFRCSCQIHHRLYITPTSYNYLRLLHGVLITAYVPIKQLRSLEHPVHINRLLSNALYTFGPLTTQRSHTTSRQSPITCILT